MNSVKKAILNTGYFARATGKLLVSQNRVQDVKTLARYLMFLQESKAIPERFIGEIFPGIDQLRTPLPLVMDHNWELPFGEKAILDGIVRLIKPSTLFEFGTATGETTVLLAEAAPKGAIVHTLDLPEELAPEIGTGVVGRAFRDKPQYADIIVQHRVDLRSFDVEPFRRAVDFIFVDAGHDFDSVTKDSELAFHMLRPGGCIVWDDYQPIHWGTVSALNELSKRHSLTRISYSRFVLHRRTD